MVGAVVKNDGLYVAVYTPPNPRRVSAYKQLLKLGAFRTPVMNCWMILHPSGKAAELLAKLERTFGQNAVLVFEVC